VAGTAGISAQTGNLSSQSVRASISGAAVRRPRRVLGPFV